MSTRCVDERLWVHELGLAPDPLSIARACEAADCGPVTLLHASDAGAAAEHASGTGRRRLDDYQRCSYVAALPDRCSHALDPVVDDDQPPPPVEQLSAGADRRLWRAPRWIGVIPYESRRELERPSWCEPDERARPLLCEPEWWRFPAVVRVDHRDGQALVVGSDRDAVERLSRAARHGVPQRPRAVSLQVVDDEPADMHLARVRRARELIYAGDLYQVNVARRIRVDAVSGPLLELHARLVSASPARFSALLRLADDTSVLSTSPELLLHAETHDGADAAGGDWPPGSGWPRFGRLTTEPIKGTRPRGCDAAEDRRLAAELDADPKERAELTMIIDVERNDLGRVSQVGSVEVVRPPHVSTHRTVLHRKARLRAMARPEVSRQDVLEAIVPSGSVTGAPKVRAMEVIRELEAERRGLYTGGLGFVAQDGSALLGMAIRTLVVRSGQGVYWTGGGIVADSEPERELEETAWKAIQLLRVAGDGAP